MKVQHSSTHPVWNEELRLLVHVPELQSLHVEIRDWDLLNASDHIGRRASHCFRLQVVDLYATWCWVCPQPRSIHK